VFAKAPVAGAVKTRLIPVLGAEKAARLHAVLVRRALGVAERSALGAVELWCAPDVHHPFFASCAQEFGVSLRLQQGGDLGERMQRAFDAAFASGHPLIVIGTDCPALAEGELLAAREALATHDAVIIPAEDGGYVLIGLSIADRGIFEGVDWGTDAVMAQTRGKMAAAGIDLVELATSRDVDRPADYERLVRSGLLGEAAF
jgi:uncharacterized protein